MGEKDEKPIRVVDRRMFTPDGELRPGFEPEENAPSPPPPLPSRPPSPPARTADAGGLVEGPGPARTDSAPPDASSEPASPQGSPDAGPEGEGDEAAGEPRGEFGAIVRSLATTAYSALGLLPDPLGARHREPAVARQMIDWLAVLESKTRNNLAFEEAEFLSRVLYELRMAFVEVMGPPPGPPGAGRTRPPGR